MAKLHQNDAMVVDGARIKTNRELNVHNETACWFDYSITLNPSEKSLVNNNKKLWAQCAYIANLEMAM